MKQPLKVIGGQESYFTGKLEAYLRAKGIAYTNIAFTPANVARVGAFTGVLQIPQVECADESWLVDTTLIIDYLDRQHPQPRTSPTDPAANLIALLLEDYADEWLWRVAMHYRWSYPNSAELLSSWLAEHMPDDNSTLAEHKASWFARQKGIFVDGDGVTEDTRGAVERSYTDALAALENLFDSQAFILGDHPTQADFGFMGPMFRHLFCDPDPARYMRDHAPGVHEWVARMWNLKPQKFAAAKPIESIPNNLVPLLEPVINTYLPYLVANQDAVMALSEQVSYTALGVDWTEPAKPYRVWCLDQLRRTYQGLKVDEQSRIEQTLGTSATAILASRPTALFDQIVPPLPITEPNPKGRDSWWRPVV